MAIMMNKVDKKELLDILKRFIDKINNKNVKLIHWNIDQNAKLLNDMVSKPVKDNLYKFTINFNIEYTDKLIIRKEKE
jgi:hypothetical protein